MARPRNPLVKAVTEGRNKKDPQRYRDRKEPAVKNELGPPPKWLVDTDASKAATAWKLFESELPWLNGAHRSILEIASNIRGRLVAGQEVGVQSLTLLRQCLSTLGATPADASKVQVPDEENDEKNDIFKRK